LISAEDICKNGVDRGTALELSRTGEERVFELFLSASKIRDRFRGRRVDLCSIVNAKSGACPEDCSFCAQSARHRTNIDVYPLMDKEKIMGAATEAVKRGVKRFCIVTSGKAPSMNDLERICDFVREINSIGLKPCATLGILPYEQLSMLKDAGLDRYHHNLETSEAFFPEICTTHTFKDKIKTIETAKSLGLSVCSGGIFGMGESWEDRIDMAFTLRELEVDSIPINFLTPIKGTPMGSRSPLNPLEALKIISIYRHILPDREIRICGGRPNTLRELNSFIFLAGADGLLVGNYLTTPGRDPEEDLQLLSDLGFKIS